jgi:hypothetical protein
MIHTVQFDIEEELSKNDENHFFVRQFFFFLCGVFRQASQGCGTA